LIGRGNFGQVYQVKHDGQGMAHQKKEDLKSLREIILRQL